MEHYKQRPCRVCRKKDCPMEDCGRWQAWFLESWAAVNAYAWKLMDEMGREEPKNFLYELPHMVKSPCESCRCSAWCDTPCSARLRWWDAKMQRLRRSMEGQ